MTSTKWTSFQIPPAPQVQESGSESESAKARLKREKRERKKRLKQEMLERYPSGSTYKARQSSYSKTLLSMVPGNHYAYEELRFKNNRVLELLNVELMENVAVDEVLKSPLPPLEKAYPEVHSFLTGKPMESNVKSKGRDPSPSPQVPFLWKQCLSELKHYVETGPKLAHSTTAEERQPLIKSREKTHKRSKSTERPVKPIGSLAGANRPLVINLLRAICNEFNGCLAFEDLRYAWPISMYGHRKIRIGPNPEDRIKVNMREDLCWRASKEPVAGVSPRDWASKKHGLGPLFAVMTKEWDEFLSVELSALADLKTLLTMLQDRRREAAYTIHDDTTTKDTQYFSYVISLTTNYTPCVSINTLSASGRYLTKMERGEAPQEDEKLVYRKGKILSLVDPRGRIEFARIMMGLLGGVCTKKEVRDKEEFAMPEPDEAQISSSPGTTGGTWDKVKRRSWFMQSLLPTNQNLSNPAQGKVVPKVTEWMSTLEVN